MQATQISLAGEVWRPHYSVAVRKKKIHRVNKDLMIVWPKATAREDSGGECATYCSKLRKHFLIDILTLKTE